MVDCGICRAGDGKSNTRKGYDAMKKPLIKKLTYIPISSEPFDMPIPIKLELHHANTLLCIYSVKADLAVDYSYNANTDIPLLTPPDKQLTLSDVYYLIRSRVFQDNPFTTPTELARLGLTEYNPYEIILRTYGMMPLDAYWIKRSDDPSMFEDAIAKHNQVMFGTQPPGPGSEIEDFLG